MSSFLTARDLTLRHIALPTQVDAVVTRIDLPVPPTLHYIELSTNVTEWINVCIAKHYGLRSIVLDPTVR